jgi:DNA-binding XRE family transcriptional regulator
VEQFKVNFPDWHDALINARKSSGMSMYQISLKTEIGYQTMRKIFNGISHSLNLFQVLDHLGYMMVIEPSSPGTLGKTILNETNLASKLREIKGFLNMSDKSMAATMGVSERTVTRYLHENYRVKVKPLIAFLVMGGMNVFFQKVIKEDNE